VIRTCQSAIRRNRRGSDASKNTAMKILTVSNCPLVQHQGSGYVVLNYCSGLRARGHKVDLFGPESFEPFKYLNGRAKNYRLTLGIFFWVLIKMIREQYDLIEFYGGQSWLAASFLSSLHDRSYLIVNHTNGPEMRYIELMAGYSEKMADSPLSKWYQFDQTKLFRKAFEKADAIITVSDDDRNYLLGQNCKDPSKIKAINNPIPDRFIGLEVDFQRGPVVGFCGTWIPKKGIDLIKRDMTRLLTEMPDVGFKLIGVGEGFRKQMHFPLELCSSIEVIPFLKDKSALISAYQTISILILPSIVESFGMVAAEAMACGCAVVTTRVGFGAELSDHEEAIIIDAAKSPQLYEAVRKLLLDEPLRIKIARNGYQKVQCLRWDNAVNILHKTYQEWLTEFRHEHNRND
jgi:glycosyltransferase involved in cell wall biosynthesis